MEKEKSNVLKNKSFIFLLISKFTSLIGTFVQSTAFALYVIDKTQDSMLFASILMATLIPKVILSPLCGVLVDWFDRKKLLIFLDVISGGILLLIGLTVGNDLSVAMIAFICMLLGIINAMDEPTTMAIMPSIVSKENLQSGNAINMIVSSLGNIIGPILGAILYTAAGIRVTLIFNALSFLIGGLFNLFIKVDKFAVEDKIKSLGRFKSDLVDGFKYIWNEKRIVKIIVCIFIQNAFFNGATTVGIPFVAKTVFNVTNNEYAMIEVVVVFGVILGALFSGLMQKGISSDKLFVRMLGLISICFFSISVVCMGFLSAKLAFYFMLGLYLLLGIASINITISFQSELQKEIKPEMLGRISSLVLALIMSSIPIGQFIYGLIFKWMNPAIPFVITAVIIFIITVYYGVTYKKGVEINGVNIPGLGA